MLTAFAFLCEKGKQKADKNRARVEENFLKLTHVQRQEAAQSRREEKKRAEKERIMNEEDPEKQRRLEVRWIFQTLQTAGTFILQYLQGCLQALPAAVPDFNAYFAGGHHALSVYAVLLSEMCEGCQWGASLPGQRCDPKHSTERCFFVLLF